MNRSIYMRQLLPVFIVCTLITTGCSMQSPPNRASSNTFTAANEAELRDGSLRVEQFRQELMSRGFRVVSRSGSESKDQVSLRGDYGGLKGVEITLWTGKRLEMKEPHLGASLQASIASEAAGQEFDRLDARLKSVIRGK
ncbi:MAG TPA: hypothetical protein VFD58_36125 [Blastocatellia bacterium]|nr:hypothetical protein [Blastocatellia bacterium]